MIKVRPNGIQTETPLLGTALDAAWDESGCVRTSPPPGIAGITPKAPCKPHRNNDVLTVGGAARDRSCPLLRTRPAPPDVLLTKQYVFFIASATDAAPVGRDQAPTGQRDLSCYAFPSESTGVDSRVSKCRWVSINAFGLERMEESYKDGPGRNRDT